MTISQLLEQLGKNKKQANKLYKEYKEYKEVEESLKIDLTTMLKSTGLRSAKGKDFTASLIEKPTVVIRDETAVIDWLKNTPNLEYDFYIGLKKPEFNTLASTMLKDTGELANGTEVEIRESLAIRSNKGVKK